MKIKVFYPEPDGSIRMSKQELQALLDEVYKEGYNDGRSQNYNIYNLRTNSGVIHTPYYTTTISSGISSSGISSSDITNSCTTISSSNSNSTFTLGGDISEPQSYQIEFKSV